jgi:hypothetical protein
MGGGYQMPAVRCYLSQDVLENVKAKAKVVNVSVSRLIREAVEKYLDIDSQKEARERVLRTLSEKKPLGGRQGWEEIHQERMSADAGRG